MAEQGLILAPPTIQVRFDLAPLLNAIDSLALLSKFVNLSGFSDWVTQTQAEMSAEEHHRHELVAKGLKFLDFEPEWPDFPAYLAHLEAQDPVALRDHAMHWMSDAEYLADIGVAMPDQAHLLGDVDYYMAFLDEVMDYYRERHGDKELGAVSQEMYAEVHALLNDPPAMKALVVDHLSHMWQRYIAPAWEGSLAMLEESLAAYRQLDFSGLTALEAIRAVTERDLSSHWERDLRKIETLVFVPSAHIGPFVRLVRNKDKSVAHIVFGARLPQGSRQHSPALNRSELLMRMTALADNTRLQILQLLTQHEELCAQDIMTMLDLSQSSASRHLRQLAATGYLLERRQDVAKCYSLNQDRVEDTLQALRRFLTTG